MLQNITGFYIFNEKHCKIIYMKLYELKNMCMLFFNNLIYLIYEYVTKYHRILF